MKGIDKIGNYVSITKVSLVKFGKIDKIGISLTKVSLAHTQLTN